EIFKGRFAEDAPDLLLEPAHLYSLTHAKTMVEPADWMVGDHRVEGVLAASGPEVDVARFPEVAHLVDLAPTILAAVEAPASVSHAGSVLSALVGSGAALSTSAEPAEDVRAGAGLDDFEAEEVEEHLRGLGYLE